MRISIRCEENLVHFTSVPVGLAYAGDVNESKREKDAEVRQINARSGKSHLVLNVFLQIGA